MTLPSDEELALNMQRGDASALQNLVERHHSPLIGFLYRMTGGDRALAEDLVQEAFLRVLKAIRQYKYPRPFKAWLYAIATNLAHDHFKRAEVRQRADTPAEKVPGQVDGPEHNLLVADEAQQVARSLQALPDGQREAVILRYYQELSLNEISEALGVPLGTVKSRLSLGLRRLREILEAER
jgi:RNA polymerase sigma-70 factor (ECF subfamily)